MSDVIAELEALRIAHAELQEQHARALATRSALEHDYGTLEQDYEGSQQDRQKLTEQNAHLEVENAALRSERKAMLQRLFGRRSERLDGIQHELFEESCSELDVEARRRQIDAEEAEKPEDTGKKKRRRRNKDLPRVRTVIDLPESERVCECCQGIMQPFGEEISEEIEYVPAVLRLRETARTKYSCPDCHEGVVVAAGGPERPIPRVTAGAGLLAHVAVSKFGHHLPLYRLEQMFCQQGGEISRRQMCGWMGRVADLLEPVVGAMKRTILREPLIQCDETTLRYQDPSRVGRTSCGYLWAYSKPWEEVVFDFRTSRSREGPSAFLKDYGGAVQIDGYAGYNELVHTNGNVRVACMAHIRRKIYEARTEHPEWAKLLLAGIQRVYRIERKARKDGICGEELVALRRGEPLRVLTVLGETLDEIKPLVLPKSGFGRAIAYAIGQWPAMLAYTEIAGAELDNNGVESAIRPVALGRKNWLFAGSEDGGRRAAILFSLVTSAKRLGLDPFEYMSDVIARTGAHKVSRLGELTPRGWKAARA